MRIRALVAACLGLALVSAVARAETPASPPRITQFRDIAASADGGAWLLGETHTAGVGEQPRQSSIWRVAPRSRNGHESAPVDIGAPALAMRAIALSSFDDSLWVVAKDAVLQRQPGGAFATLALATSEDDATIYGATSAFIVPFARKRATIFRPCNPSPCTEVLIVDFEDKTVRQSRIDGWLVGPGVSDDQGGVWALVEILPHYDNHQRADTGYAHFTGSSWDVWTSDASAVPGMQLRGKTTITSRWSSGIARDGNGGFVAANDHELFFVDARGSLASTETIPQPAAGYANALGSNATLDVVRDEGEGAWVVVGGHPYFGSDTSIDPSPALRTLRRADRTWRVETAQTPGWWRRAHDASTPRARAASGGGVLWVLTYDALFRRVDGTWDTYPASGGREGQHDSVVQPLFSLPLNLGYAARNGYRGGFAIGVRPELLLAPQTRPIPYGLGIFAEIATDAGLPARETLLGGGVTANLYEGDVLGLAASAGADARWSAGVATVQPVFSVFGGFRGCKLMCPFDAPFGLRLDIRPAEGAAPMTTTLLASLDMPAFVALDAALLQFFTHGHR